MLRTIPYCINRSDLRVLVKEIGIDRQFHPPIAWNRYRYAIPQPIDRVLSKVHGLSGLVSSLGSWQKETLVRRELQGSRRHAPSAWRDIPHIRRCLSILLYVKKFGG